MAQTTTLRIKNMVCPRCILAVQDILHQVGLEVLKVELGVAEVRGTLSSESLEILRRRLSEVGFKLLDDQQQCLVDEIRTAIIERVHYKDDPWDENLSEYLSQRCHRDYSALSKLFKEMTSTSIERYYLSQKIERVKELLTYGEMTISEIAHKLHYSSVAHLSSQFRNIVGMTPSEFRAQKKPELKTLDEI